MAEGKNTFNLYADMIGVFEALPDDKAGQLIKHIFRYVNDQNPETDDLVLNIAFEPIKAKLKRDLAKWLGVCDKNRDNIGKRWNKENTTVYDRIPNDTKNTDKDKDKDKDNIKEVVKILNSILGSQYRENSKATVSHISARLAEGFTVENFRQVIQTKFDQWNNDPKMKSYLRPETLFGTKFESYLNEAKIKEPEKPKQKNFYILQEHDDYLKELGYEKYLEFMKSKGVVPMLNAQGDEV